jgi:UDP-N-acetylglucosamine--N-acetylmuramyl-(pentapeptide) pyrophosphoryl-undecaprenol N-acetylglucosamine transferase
MAGRVLIMAGGTGGHVYPALAVARELQSRGAEVLWLGTRRGLEAAVVPQAGIDIEWINISGLRGRGLGAWLAVPYRVSRAIVEAMRIVLRRRPTVALGMGGFATGPGGVASWLLRVPLVIHEQNAVPGLTNRLLSRLAARVLEAFPGSFPDACDAVHTGNPVRADIAELAPPQSRLRGRSGPLRLLVLGGSQGARRLNEEMPKALARMPAGERPLVWQQTGPRHLDPTVERYRCAGLEVRIEPFIEDMAAAYGWADLVFCRAGAMTVAELAAAGLASILVPYPFAVDDHQTRNADYLVQAGAAIRMEERALNVERLTALVLELARDRARVLRMAVAARRCGSSDAARRVAEICLGGGR